MAQALKDYLVEHYQFTPSAKGFSYHETRLNNSFKDYVSGVTQISVNKHVRECKERNESNGTIRKDLEILKASLNHEERARRLIYVPKFKMPPPPPSRSKSLTEGQIGQIAAIAKSQHIKDFTWLMWDTGQRPGAIEQLKWFAVDFKMRIINFDLVERAGKIVEREQSNKRVRPIPMSDRVYDILKRLYKKKTTEFVLEYLDPITKRIKPAGCVKKAFERACDDADVDASRYTIRHAFANRDMDEITRMQFMGHTKVKTSREHYIKTNIPKMREVFKRPKNSPKQKDTKW